MRNPFSDPLTFWSRVLIRLGLVLGLLAVAPVVLDFMIFKGAAIVLATMALYTLAPISVLCLAVGVTLWLWGRLRK